MLARILKAPFLTLIIAVGVFSIMSVGGCPAPQQPQPPSTSEPNEGTTTPGGEEGSGTGEGDRPIEQPDLGEGTSDSGDQFPGEGGETGEEGGAGQGQGEFVLISVAEPSNTIAVRPGAVITVEFRLVDVAGSVNSTNLALWRDDDADGVRDTDAEGNTLDPVWTQAISAVPGDNTATFDTNAAVGLLSDGLGRFLIGVQATTVSNDTVEGFSPATITIDSVEPTATWVSPLNDELVTRNNNWTVEVQTSDNAPHTVRILLDPDQNPESGNEFELIAATEFPAGSDTRTFTTSLAGYPAGLYYYYVIVSDGIEPPVGFYGENAGALVRLRTTNRLVGEIPLDSLLDSPNGAILQGVEFNDLTGSSLAAVPDVNGDGNDEIIIGARFGKVANLQYEGVGFGKAYLLYGNGNQRLHGVVPLSAVGNLGFDGTPLEPQGLVFDGIRTPVSIGDTVNPGSDPRSSLKWTYGLSDITVVPDMDGDDLPELVFAFPRVESISVAVDLPQIQDEATVPGGVAGIFEFNSVALTMSGLKWVPNMAQFTRGGIVIVSSHNYALRRPSVRTPMGNRHIDLQVVGQQFFGENNESIGPPGFRPYIREVIDDPNGSTLAVDCDQDGTTDKELIVKLVRWDIVMDGQGPGGFWNALVDGRFADASKPPLSNIWATYGLSIADFDASKLPPPDPDPMADLDAMCSAECTFRNVWYKWNDGQFLPCTNPGASATGEFSWYETEPSGMGDPVPWTGFLQAGEGEDSLHVAPEPTASVGCRVLGQRVNDLFGTTVACTGFHLYISAPNRTAKKRLNGFDNDNVPDLPDAGGERRGSGVVYQLRTRYFPGNAPVTMTQLWIEPPDPNEAGNRIYYPNRDAEISNPQSAFATDYTMPTPHQYIIDEVGYSRGDDAIDGQRIHKWGIEQDDCIDNIRPDFLEGLRVDGGGDADTCYFGVFPYNAYAQVDSAQQIVGPHEDAHITFVRGVGDVNGDGVPDYAVGSPDIHADYTDPTSDTVGAIFIVPGVAPGGEGSVLLERILMDPGAAEKINGLALRGVPGSELGRVFDGVGQVDPVTNLVAADFNGDGLSDVIVGSPGSNEAILILGARTALGKSSPLNGWTIDDIVDAGLAIRFVGADPNDQTGFNVAGAGDIDGDGFGDILIAAPGAEGGKGVVYLIYGDPAILDLPQPISLADVGTVDLPGAVFVGRRAGDQVGGGTKSVSGVIPDSPSTSIDVFSRGVSGAGDLDHDGFGDLLIGAMLADPGEHTDAGEVYVIYGSGGD